MTVTALPNLLRYRQAISGLDPVCVNGRIIQVVGLTVEAAGLESQIGEIYKIQTGEAEPLLAEVVGFRDDRALLMPLGDMQGIQSGSPITLHPNHSAPRPALACSGACWTAWAARWTAAAWAALIFSTSPPTAAPRRPAAPAHRRAAGHRRAGHRRHADLRQGPAHGHFRGQRRGQKHPAGHRSPATPAPTST